MGKNVFSLPIFFIVFRETLEAAIIISVLLGLAEQIVHEDKGTLTNATASTSHDSTTKSGSMSDGVEIEDSALQRRRLLKKLRLQIFLGAALGLFISLAIGAAFIAVWFTKASDLWSRSESLWEAIFELIAALMIFMMGITMLKMDRAKTKWRIKLEKAFSGKRVDSRTVTGKWALFILPFVTVLREGMEGVVFVGGVSLGQSATAIPIAAIVGVVCGLVCGFIIYEFASRSTLRLFMIVMTNFLLLIGAGLFSRCVGSFQQNTFNHVVGGDAAESGDGPGSFDVRGSVWHLDCCNPNSTLDGQGWLIFGGLFGWTNSATIGTVLGYVFYWLTVMATLIYMKFKEGRTKLLGFESAAAIRRRNGKQRVEQVNQTITQENKEYDESAVKNL